MDSLKHESQNLHTTNGLFKNKTATQSASFGDSLSMSRVSAEEMDEIRQQNIAYEYLCHLEEAKK
jgi:hypothetical protein